MRLIDADEMLKNLTEAYINTYPKCDALTATVNTVVHEKITRLIKDTPTAYDIDKVVEQLEKEYENAEHEWEETCDPHYNGEAIAFVRAIEIVKKGGVE